ncbi:Bacterial regulatory helix-turn-helix protein, lysR family [compost metagenome]
MDSLNGFTVFVKIAETGSIVAAGRSLGISASAVGKSLIRLEEKIGVTLVAYDASSTPSHGSGAFESNNSTTTNHPS